MDWRDDLIKSQNQIIEELRAELVQRDKIIAELREIIARQNERIAELERRLGLDSSNSGNPPSSDGLKKPVRVQSLREKSGKKCGGQLGHQGSTLEQVENPDSIKHYQTTHCPHCNTDLTNAPVIDVCKKQVFDIPEIVKPIVTEHQFEVKRCPCCLKRIKTQKSEAFKAPVQYGSRVKAVVSYLNIHNLIPVNRVVQIMESVFGTPTSEATVENIVKECAANVKPIVEQIEEQLKKAPRKGADESGFRIDGKTLWAHTLSNDNFTHYRASEKRGDIPNDLEGVVVHDHFVSYYAKMEKAQHALCNAHHLRELKAVEEIDKEPWARDMARLLLFGHNFAQQKRHDITLEWLERFKRLFDQIVCKGLAFHEKLGVLKTPPRGRIKRRPGHNLLLRLQNRADDVLRFLHDQNVPFTNNQSEQALRMIKVKQKVSGCFRTKKGAGDFLTIRSYTATAQKQGFKILDALTSVFRGEPLNLVPT